MVPFRSFPIRLLMAGGGVTLLVVAVSAASEPGLGAMTFSNGETIHACFTPAGTMYLIKQPGLSQECKGNHVEIFWNVQGPQGEQGEQGPQGDQGPPGEPGEGGVLGYEVLEVSSPGNASVFCPVGKRALGGGYFAADGSNIFSSHPLEVLGDKGLGWGALSDLADASAPLTAFVICAFVNE